MQVFITGIESFLGNFLVKSLSKKNILFSGIDLEKKNIFTTKLDLNDQGLKEIIPKNSDAVIHLAAISSTKDFETNVKRGYKVNIDGTINLIKASIEKNVKQIIFASSEWVYGEKNFEKKNESTPIEYESLSSEYSLSKAIGENILKYYCSLYKINCTILRFGIIYGPRINNKNWSAVESILYEMYLSKKITVGSKKTARRFIYSEDVIEGIISSIGRNGIEVFNLTGDKLITLENIFETGCKILDIKSEMVEKDPNNYNIRDADNQLIKKKTGWIPKFDILAGSKKIIDNFKK